MSRGANVLVRLLPVVCAAAFLVALDLLFLVSLLQPLAFFGFAVVFGLLAMLGGGSASLRALQLLLVLLASLLISAIDWTTDKRFVRALHRLTPGMSEESVRDAMAGFVEGTGWPTNTLAEPNDPAAELRVQGALVFRPSVAPGDSNWGIVRFGPDRLVLSVEFNAD